MILEEELLAPKESWNELSLNSSLHQVVEPLASWEWVCVAAHILTDLTLAMLVFHQWHRFGKNSPRLLKYSLVVMYAGTLTSAPFAVISTSQALTPQYTFPFYLGQFSYVAILNASYLVLFAKQQILYDSGIASIISEKLTQRRSILVVLFKLWFASYALGIVGIQFIPTVMTIVIKETYTTQSVRVAYYTPTWVRAMFAIGDTTMSLVCLALFLIPVLAFQNVAVQIGVADASTIHNNTQINATKKRLRSAAYLNFKWTVLSTITTFIFLAAGGELLPEYGTLWAFGGAFDVLVKIICLGKMFPQSNKAALNNVLQSTGQALTPLKSSNFSSNDTGLSVVYRAPKQKRRSMRLFSN